MNSVVWRERINILRGSHWKSVQIADLLYRNYRIMRWPICVTLWLSYSKKEIIFLALIGLFETRWNKAAPCVLRDFVYSSEILNILLSLWTFWFDIIFFFYCFCFFTLFLSGSAFSCVEYVHKLLDHNDFILLFILLILLLKYWFLDTSFLLKFVTFLFAWSFRFCVMWLRVPMRFTAPAAPGCLSRSQSSHDWSVCPAWAAAGTDGPLGQPWQLHTRVPPGEEISAALFRQDLG